MRIDVISVLPELLESPLAHSIMKRAQTKGLLQVQVHNLRQWAVNEYGQVDDYQDGGGAGLARVEIIKMGFVFGAGCIPEYLDTLAVLDGPVHHRDLRIAEGLLRDVAALFGFADFRKLDAVA